MTSVQTRHVTDYPSTDHLRGPRSRPEALSPPRSMSELIQGLHYIFEDDHIDVEGVKKYMASYKNLESDWIDKAQFDDYR